MRAVIFLSASYNIGGFLFEPNDIIICADGGLRHALAEGFKPHILIGDMDSVNETDIAVLKNDTEILRFKKEKDETDGLLALEKALEMEPEEIIFLGALGGRLDHCLGNINLLVKISGARKNGHNVNACIKGENECVYLADIYSPLFPKCEEGQTLSIIPITEIRVSTQNLMYPLYNEVLSLGDVRGLSNVCLSDDACVTIHSGIAVVILNN